jgi:molecular chaperone DnaK (HSP70)/HEAT repeat protein
MSYKFSIDFGTTNSVIARWNGQQRETVALPGISVQVGEHFLIPSQLYVRDGRAGDVVIGAAVKASGLDNQRDNRLFRNFKRGIGANSGREPRIIDGAPWSDADAGQHFVRHILRALPCKTDEIEQLVITVPVAAFAGYSAWLNSALEGFPPERIQIVDESTAAALGYAVTEPGANVLISDFGGGTLDLSLVRLPESGSHGTSLANLTGGTRSGAAQVIAKVGVTLGGSDVDQWLLSDILERAQLTLQVLGMGFAPLLSACEHAKIILSTAEETQITILPGQTMQITRAELEAVLEKRGFFNALREALDKLLGQAHQRGVFKEDVGHVLLVGGTSLIPSVQRAFDSYFRAITQGRRKISLPTWPALHWTVENTTIRVDKPFTAVVEGALQISAGLGLDDQLTYSYGLLVADSATGQHRYEELIPAGSRYPSAPVTVKLAAAFAGQHAITLTFGQIDTSAISAIEVRYEAGQAIFVSQPDQNQEKIVALNAENPICIPLDSPGEPGKERLSAVFSVDAARKLHLTVTDLKTRKKRFDDAIPLEAVTHSPEHDKKNGEDLAPALAVARSGGGYRLSLRNLASALNLLPASQVSDEVLAAALRAADPLARFSAAEVLCKRGDREARLIIEDVLTNGTPPQRASAVQHVYRFSWFTADGLFKRALQDSDVRVREGAVFGLCKMRLPEAYRLALEALRGPAANDALRKAAIWGAFSRPDAGAVPMLSEIIAEGSPEIREQALEVLGATGSPQGIAVAKRALNDPDLTTKYAAAFSWVELAGDASFAELANAIEAERGEAREAILRGLFHGINYIGIDAATSPDADRLVAACAAALIDNLPQTRIAATLPLAWIRRPLAEQALRDGFARETESNVKAQMLRIAVNLSSPAAGEILEAALKDEDVLVRQTGEYLKQ